MIQANPRYKTAYENITSIVRVGQIAGIALLYLFIKYPKANQRQITSLAGLNLACNQSAHLCKHVLKYLNQVQYFIEEHCLWER